MLRFLAVLTTLIAALTVSVPQALAQACTGRPGASAIEQYCEAIPEGTGERVGPSSGGDRQGSSGVSKSTSQQLQDAGSDGQAVLGVVATDGGDDGDGGASGGKSSSGSDGAKAESTQVTPAKSPSDNPLKAVSSSVSNGSTVGPGFLWGMLALAGAAGAAGWVGFRRHHQPATDE